MDSIALIQAAQSSCLVVMTCGSSAAPGRTTGELLCFHISLLLSYSSVLLTNDLDWGTNTKQLDTSGILCHKWQTWICPSQRCRKLLTHAVCASFWGFLFDSLGVLCPERTKFASAPLDLPSWVVICPTDRMFETGLWAPDALLFKEEPETCHFPQKYPAPFGLISPGSKWY